MTKPGYKRMQIPWYTGR